jgi:regulatory protein
MTSQEPSSSRPDAAECRRRALDLLARREHSRDELERKLRARGFADATLAQTLTSLEADGLLADQRFAESFVRSRIGRGQGPARIRAELAARGVDQTCAAEQLATTEADWVRLAARARIRRFGPARPENHKERARQARFLQTRGFDTAQIMAALDLTDELD